jgi:hypothetical protein
MIKVLTTHTIDPEIWDQFVESHPLGTIFHHSLWQGVISKTYGYQPLYHVILDKSVKLQAAISSAFIKSWITGNRIISYTFSDVCDPLVKNSAELAVLLEALQRSRCELKARFVELRFTKNYCHSGNNPIQPKYYTYQLDLDREPEELFRFFHQSCIQRAIKKANRQQLEVITGEKLQNLEEFYRLHIKTRKKHGVLIQPFNFFKNLWDALTPRNMLSLLLVRHKGKFVAGIILLWMNKTAHYKFGASDSKFLHFRVNQWLMWEAIKQAKKKGCKRFDFGRASVDNNGLSKYKSRWGTQNSPLDYCQMPIDQKNSILLEGIRQHKILKKLIMRMPKIGLRVGGEIFYKHLA